MTHLTNDLVLVSRLFETLAVANNPINPDPPFSRVAPYFVVAGESQIGDDWFNVSTGIAVATGDDSQSHFSRNAKQVMTRAVPGKFLIPIRTYQETTKIAEISRLEYGEGHQQGFCNVRLYSYRDRLTLTIAEILDENGKGINEGLWSINVCEPIANYMSILVRLLYDRDLDHVVHYVPPRPDANLRGDDFALVQFRTAARVKKSFRALQYGNVDFHTARRGWVESTIGQPFAPIIPPDLTEQLITESDNG